MARIIVLSGPVDSGKTTLCRQLAEQARRQDRDCAGLVCPARFEGALKVGVDVIDLRTGERRALAWVDEQPAPVRTPGYRFDQAALAWGAAALDAAAPCDLLIVDELGPLEVVRGQGWANALVVLRGGRFRLAVAVVRPALLDVLQAAVPGARTLTLPADPATDPLLTILALLDNPRSELG